MKHLLVSYLKIGYSWFVRRCSHHYQSQPLKKQVCYLMSFPNNNHGLIESLEKQYDVVVLYTKKCEKEANQLPKTHLVSFSLDSLKGLVNGIKMMSQSQVIIADNYFAFLGDCEFKKEQTIFQLWHATGAIKQFGLEDKQAMTRSESDKKRFKRVYDSFDYVFVASKKMGDVFKRSYGFEDSQILYTGFPRTDYLLKETQKVSSDTRHILYLPTYRESIEMDKWLIDIDTLTKSLGKNDLLQIKLHPHVDVVRKSNDKVQWIDCSQSADEYIKQADVLITDYSSTAFDFTLANKDKQLIMFWPDELEYKKITGIQPNIENVFPDKVARTTQEVIEQLFKEDKPSNESFNQTWNTYNDGKAQARVLAEIKQAMDGEK